MADFSLPQEQRELQQLARDFTRNEIIPVAEHHDRTGEFPQQIINKAHEIGLMNLFVPEEYGGLGLHVMEEVIVGEELAYGCSGVSTAMSVNALAGAPVMIAGTDEQKREFLAPLIDEPIIASYAVSEPNAGSDVAGISTTARRVGDEYVINGTKQWITGAGYARWFYVLAKTDPDAGHRGMSAFLVPADTPGVSVGKKEDMMGQRASSTHAVTFEDVTIPARYLLGSEGQGFKIAMGAFDFTRPGVAAAALGVAQRALDEAVKYSRERVAFGQPIAMNQGVSFMIADMAADIEAARLLTWKSAWQRDSGERNTKVASMAKRTAGDLAMRASTDAVQILGGYGYSREYPVEKLMRDAKIFQIYEGTQQIQRLIIAREVILPRG
jgi:acyl-CoA dehydrogenase